MVNYSGDFDAPIATLMAPIALSAIRAGNVVTGDSGALTK